MTFEDICREHERLLTENKQTFRAAGPGDLTDFGQTVVAVYLTRGVNISWELGEVNVASSYIIKINDPGLSYLLILPEGSYRNQSCDEFVFYWKGHQTQISPDQASAYLIKKIFPDLNLVRPENQHGTSES